MTPLRLGNTRIILQAALVACFGCNDRPIAATEALPGVGERTPTFAFTGSKGELISDSSLLGQPSVLVLWSTHCPTSRETLQDVKTVLAHVSALEVPIVMLASDAEAGVVESVLAASGVSLPFAAIGTHVQELFDRSATAPERNTLRVEYVEPYFVVLDADGRVAYRQWGPGSEAVLSAVDSLVGR